MFYLLSVIGDLRLVIFKTQAKQRPVLLRRRATKPKIVAPQERIPLRGFLRALRILAVQAEHQFHREDAKNAKKSLCKLVWLGPGCTNAGVPENNRSQITDHR
jgi:hypothetical protein